MNAARLTSLSMAVAGFMLAHQTASKAVREAVFLSGPGVARLPAMVIVTAAVVVAAVPIWSRLLTRFGPRAMVPAGFLLSAVAHAAEWLLPQREAWVAVLVYLHVAGFGALLLSGFWSLTSELFDPREARTSFGRIAAAGTAGGLLGGGAVYLINVDDSLLLLAVLHLACAVGVWIVAREVPESSLADASDRRERLLDWASIRKSPYVITMGLLVLLSTASAGIVDYLFKKGVADMAESREELQQFFALFYMAVGLLTFLAQAGVGPVLNRLGIGRTVSMLPLGLGGSTGLALFFPSFWFIAATRGIEAVLRGSWFRSGYELLFVPMAPEEKRNTKTFIDVTCDRAGDAVGAGIVQGLIFLSVTVPAVAAWQGAELLSIVLGMAALSIWLGRRVDSLYLNVVAERLADQNTGDEIALQSETGWTLLELPKELRAARPAPTPSPPPGAPKPTPADARTQRLMDLRSGDRGRVEAGLRAITRPDLTEVAQIVQLLAWDDLAPLARHTLERVAGEHLGLLEDALLNPETDFAIRRRIPKVLSSIGTGRALEALMSGLNDGRFEVRYQCARAINRLRSRNPDLTVDTDRIMDIVQRELSVPLNVWQGHRLLDQGEPDEVLDWLDPQSGTSQRNLEHIFALLAIVLPRDTLLAAFRGIQSDDPELRALTLEYFEGVLPPPVQARLWALPHFAELRKKDEEKPEEKAEEPRAHGDTEGDGDAKKGS